MNLITLTELEKMFDSQVVRLLQADYPKLVGISELEFENLVAPLKENLIQLNVFDVDLEKGYLPFVLVVQNTILDEEQAMLTVVKNGMCGVVKLNPLTPKDFEYTGDIALPQNNAYLLVDIDRGSQTLNVPPQKAKEMIAAQNRMALTIAEGIAIVTHYPDFLIKNNCFSLLASRHAGDKRVPAIWINGEKKVNLGWCWDGNPHTWLGSASCKLRLG